MKSQIEVALQILVGEPLTDMWRYAGCQKFEFGVQRPARNRSGEEITLADFGLVVSCDWRIIGPTGDVVSSDDFGPGDSRSDGGARPFYHLIRSAPPVVGGIGANDSGALRVQLSRGYTLEVTPTVDIEPHDEQWRFMRRSKDQSHVVLWGDGLNGGALGGQLALPFARGGVLKFVLAGLPDAAVKESAERVSETPVFPQDLVLTAENGLIACVHSQPRSRPRPTGVPNPEPAPSPC